MSRTDCPRYFFFFELLDLVVLETMDDAEFVVLVVVVAVAAACALLALPGAGSVPIGCESHGASPETTFAWRPA